MEQMFALLNDNVVILLSVMQVPWLVVSEAEDQETVLKSVCQDFSTCVDHKSCLNSA